MPPIPRRGAALAGAERFGRAWRAARRCPPPCWPARARQDGTLAQRLIAHVEARRYHECASFAAVAAGLALPRDTLTSWLLVGWGIGASYAGTC